MKKKKMIKTGSRKSKVKRESSKKLKKKISRVRSKMPRAKKARSTPKAKRESVPKSLYVRTPRDVISSSIKETIEASKFTAVQTPEEEIVSYNLPPRYYDNRIVLLARDPWWLHTYWDISQKKIDEVVALIPDHEREGLRWILRVYDVTGVRNFNGHNAHRFFDVGVQLEANNWYVNVTEHEKEWCIDIGLVNAQGTFFLVARSNIIKAPYFGISDMIDEEWAIDEDLYFKVLGIYDLGKSSLERRKKFEEIIKYQISSAAFSPGISSLFSRMAPPEQKKFFLEVWTELILYGRTEADANVTVAGKKVKLRSDGTFSLRYALPEGNFEYKVVATSADKKDTREITPAVKRYTK
jgi:hypothetical protein